MEVVKKTKRYFVAVDMGASGIKIIKSYMENGKIFFSVHSRIPSFSYKKSGIEFWDIKKIFNAIDADLNKIGKNKIASVGIDSWGVDFGLIDKNGRVLNDPLHYRSMFFLQEEIGDLIFKFRPSIEERVPTKFFPFNSVYQLLMYRQKFPELLSLADKILSIPSLISFMLTGKKQYEFTQASTTQLFDYSGMTWDRELIEKLGLPDVFPEVSKAGTDSGFSENRGYKVILPATHDSASAFFSVASDFDNSLLLSLGSWCIAGIITDRIKDKKVILENGFSVEGCADGKLRCLTNTAGFWLIDSLRKEWKAKSGKEFSNEELTELTERSSSLSCVLDVDNPLFQKSQDSDGEIRKIILKSCGKSDLSYGEIVRAVLEGIAVKINETKERMEKIFNIEIKKVISVGGGSRNRLLCQLITNKTGLPLTAGIYEGTALGNILILMKSAGLFKSYEEARAVLNESEEITVYYPESCL